MKLSLDQTTDFSNRQLFHLMKDISLPAYVKTAEVDTYESAAALDKSAFADPDRRLYPIHTPESVFVSNVFFQDKKAEIVKRWGEKYANQLEAQIKQAADIFGIAEDVQKSTEKVVEKNASDYPEDFVCVIKVSEDLEFPVLPVKTAADLSHAADMFSRRTHQYPFEWRSKIAAGIIKKAKELGVDEIPDLVGKYAGMFYPATEGLVKELWYRSTKLAKQEDKDLMSKLSETVEGLNTNEDFMKLAETIFYIEKCAGLYDVPERPCILRDPVDVIFSLPVEKVASDLNLVEMAGFKYRMEDLKKVSADIYKEAFGFDVDTSNEQNLRDFVPTAPRTDVAIFREISGIQPVA